MPKRKMYKSISEVIKKTKENKSTLSNKKHKNAIEDQINLNHTKTKQLNQPINTIAKSFKVKKKYDANIKSKYKIKYKRSGTKTKNERMHKEPYIDSCPGCGSFETAKSLFAPISEMIKDNNCHYEIGLCFESTEKQYQIHLKPLLVMNVRKRSSNFVSLMESNNADKSLDSLKKVVVCPSDLLCEVNAGRRDVYRSNSNILLKLAVHNHHSKSRSSIVNSMSSSDLFNSK